MVLTGGRACVLAQRQGSRFSSGLALPAPHTLISSRASEGCGLDHASSPSFRPSPGALSERVRSGTLLLKSSSGDAVI